MASTTTTNSSDSKEIVTEIPPYIRVFNDGTVERTWESPFVPPMLHEPQNGISSKDITISSNNPTISARIYLPKLNKSIIDQEKFPILVYFHGGWFFLGSAFCQLFQAYLNQLVPKANAIVVSVEYRLAPENPLPACYNDCWDALKWVASHRDATENTADTEPWLINHGDFNRVFIGGDSAGGNITHNIAMRAGSEALPCDVKILGAILGHPFFYSSKPIGSEPVIAQEKDLSILVWNLVYPSAPGGIDNPMVNPVGEGAPSLATLGCCRILVSVAGKDQHRDRGVWYYEAVKNSGWKGEIQLFEEKDEDHVYHCFNPETDNAHKLFSIMASFLNSVKSLPFYSSN